MKIFFILIVFIALSCNVQEVKNVKPDRGVEFILDMVHNNPGEPPTISKYNDPGHVKKVGYNGMVTQWNVSCAIDYDNFEKDLVPKNSKERRWIENHASDIDKKLKKIDSVGMNVYAFTDVFVVPEAIWSKYGNKIGDVETNFHGYGGDITNVRKPSIQYELVEELMKAQVNGIFDRFPSIDGLVIRFGETYLHDTPYHMGGKPLRQGAEGIEDHVKLLNLLREEVCVKRNKKIFYRTWDFGWFHTNPEVYLSITDRIQTHENLVFSIKHTKGDFLRHFPFNPTIGIGKHPQVVEVQCQREYEGKGAHPNYIAEAVINGFEEYEGLEGISDLKSHPNFKGVWTWSRGGGWKGPYISNELWCDLNAFVLSKWSQDTTRSEVEIFDEYTRELELSEEDGRTFRQISLLSPKGVLYGRSSMLVKINPWWIRDQFMGGLTTDEFNDHTDEAWGKLNESFAEILDKGIVDEILAEKSKAVNMWNEMEVMSASITSGSKDFRDYLNVSCRYGRIKYEIIQQAWVIMLKGIEGEKSGEFDKDAIHKAYQNYRLLWEEFESLKTNNVQCASLYLPFGFDNGFKELHGEEGMQNAIKKYVSLSN